MKAIKLALFIFCAFLAQPAFAYTLSVVNGAGVIGSPANSNKNYPPGRVVPYSYAPAPGYASVTVVVDGKIMPPKGAIKMKANRWIYAYANPLTGKLFGKMITVPSDPTKILYPQFFQNRKPSTVRVADPYCAVTSDTISYPASYLGDFPLPKIVGAPLAKSIRRGAAVKDYWQFGMDDPSTNAGCGGSLHDAFIASMKRLKSVGAQYVGVFRDAAWKNLNAPNLTIVPYAEWAISPTELKWIVKQAHALGLKVHDYRQIQGDLIGNPNPTEPTLEFAGRMWDSYIPWIVARAREAQAAGVDVFELDATGIYFTNMTVGSDLQQQFIAKFSEAADKVRAVYHGKIVFGAQQPWLSGDPGLLAKVDYVLIDVFPTNADAQDDISPSVPVLKQKYLDWINAMATVFGNKPAIFQVFAQSTRHWFKTSWIEDGFCVADGNNPCKQRKVDIDFSVQAIAYEAMFEAIGEQTAMPTFAVEAASYWFVDVILPKDSFPNLSQSWRNKPAEAILRKWYRK